MNHPVKHILDTAAAAITVSTVLGLLPHIAAGFAIGWYILGYIEKFSGKTISELIRRK